MAARDYGEYGGVTRALELVGERWALLIVRDLLAGPRRYGELAAGLPRIPSNILAARLKELQAAGVIRRAPRSRVIIYELTPYGRELEPVVLAFGAWGFKAMGEPRDEQIITPDSLTMDLRAAFRASVAAGLPATAYGARVRGVDLLVRVDGSSLELHRGAGALDAPGDGSVAAPVDLAFAAGPGIHRLISGELTPDRAIATGAVELLRGPGELLDRFASTFHLAA
jgi:DNA-binding HxlR family transcriptional regulator